MMNLSRWHALMATLCFPSSDDTGRALIAAYAEPQRHYHTARHIEDCLAKLDEARHLAADAGEVELALWFHDAVYNPLKGGNELASAEWATKFLREAGAAQERIARVHALIMATQHAVPASTPDAQLLVDIDLSILGADEAGYAEFERNVRKEYRWVPYFLYRKKRREILQSFLDRPHVYSLAFFQDRFEAKARANLREAITNLQATAKLAYWRGVPAIFALQGAWMLEFARELDWRSDNISHLGRWLSEPLFAAKCGSSKRSQKNFA